MSMSHTHHESDDHLLALAQRLGLADNAAVVIRLIGLRRLWYARPILDR